MLRRNNNYMPDVLDCLANLSNDEVFTPPNIVNKMLDMLPQEVFQSRDTTFLDPFTKSGVFLREITKRLLENQVPGYNETYREMEFITREAIQDAVRNGKLDLNDADYEKKARAIGDAAIKASPEANRFLNFEIDLQDALDHILTKQVFGIAITELTAHLSRRSLYCSKDASGRYSVAGTAFGNNKNGNIRFVPMRHSWKNGTCIYCGASASNMERPNELESHAYEFIHTDRPEEIVMGLQFTVICGNPPFQLADGGAGASATPLYHRFIQQAKRLNPRYLTMIIPSRWFAGGKGLDDFRVEMLNDDSISKIVDYPNAKDCFPSNNVSGGVMYFLRDKDYHGVCDFTTIIAGKNTTVERILNEYDIFVRYSNALSIIKKVENNSERYMTEIVSSRRPFDLNSYERGHANKLKGDCHLVSSKGNSFIQRSMINKGHDLIDTWQVIIGKALSGHIGETDENGQVKVLAKIDLLPPNTVATESYLCIGNYEKEEYAKNLLSYLTTKFVRFLLLQALTSMNITKDKFRFVPLQDFSKPWTDEELYAKYELTQDEIDFIESMIKPME